MVLKPQDVVVALKLCSYPAARPSFAQVAVDLGMSPSEIHAAVKRLEFAGLVSSRLFGERPNISALEEFLIHGVKYVFPAERGEMTRGVLTSYAASPLKEKLSLGNEPRPVWPFSDGAHKGIALKPLYKTAPAAALRDPVLYEYLALVDAIRDGRMRERKIAERELSERLHKGR